MAILRKKRWIGLAVAALAAALGLLWSGDAGRLAEADPGRTWQEDCRRYCRLEPKCGQACFWPECRKCATCLRERCWSDGVDDTCEWEEYDCAPCRREIWHARGYGNQCRGGVVTVGDYLLTGYGMGLDRAGRPPPGRILCTSDTGSPTAVPTLTGVPTRIPSGNLELPHHFANATPQPGGTRLGQSQWPSPAAPSFGAAVSGVPTRIAPTLTALPALPGTPAPDGVMTRDAWAARMYAGLPALDARTPGSPEVLFQATRTLVPNWGPPPALGATPRPTQTRQPGVVWVPQAGGATRVPFRTRPVVATPLPTLPAGEAPRTGTRPESVLQYRTWLYASITPPEYLVPFQDVTTNYLANAGRVTGWWAVQFRYRWPAWPGGRVAEAVGGWSQVYPFWVWNPDDAAKFAQTSVANYGSVPPPTPPPTPVLAAGESLRRSLDWNYATSVATRFAAVGKPDDVLLRALGSGDPTAGGQYRIWPFSGGYPGPEYDRWWPLDAMWKHSDGRWYMVLLGSSLQQGRPPGYDAKWQPLPTWAPPGGLPLQPMLWSIQFRRRSEILDGDGKVTRTVYGPATQPLTVMVGIGVQRQPTPTPPG